MAIHDDFVPPFRDRSEAGRLLAGQLQSWAGRPDVIVCALPRGGVLVGAEIARALDVPLFVSVVRKLGVPEHEDLAMGAVTSSGKTFINPAVVNALHISEQEIGLEVGRELPELRRRERLYCRGVELPNVKDKIVILADDGVTTGSSIFLVVQALQEQGAAYIIAAIPAGLAETVVKLHRVANEVVCLVEVEPSVAVGASYKDFHPVTDHEVCVILDHMLERTRTNELCSA